MTLAGKKKKEKKEGIVSICSTYQDERKPGKNSAKTTYPFLQLLLDLNLLDLIHHPQNLVHGLRILHKLLPLLLPRPGGGGPLGTPVSSRPGYTSRHYPIQNRNVLLQLCEAGLVLFPQLTRVGKVDVCSVAAAAVVLALMRRENKVDVVQSAGF